MRTTLIAAAVALVASTAIDARAQQLPSVRDTQPWELTSRGNISGQAREHYREAVEDCYRRRNDLPQIVACLKQQLRTEDGALNSAYTSSRSILKSSPRDLIKLRDAQRAWLQFRDKNCEFAKLVAPKGHGDEFLYDCLLALTIERRTELRSLIGD
jgi:uncharacterized protein YecT (DUF1311 family)